MFHWFHKEEEKPMSTVLDKLAQWANTLQGMLPWGWFQENSQTLLLLSEALGVPWLVDQCRQYNPQLTAVQQAQLSTMLRRTLRDWHQDKPVRDSLCAIVALAVPDGPTVLELVDGILHWMQTRDTGSESSAPAHSDLNNASHAHEPTADDLENQHVLCDGYGCARGVVESLDAATRQALRQALDSRPSCAITLDELVLANGKLDRNVAVIAQTTSADQSHAYLYRRDALERWFNSQPRPANPVTRQPVDRARQYFVLS